MKSQIPIKNFVRFVHLVDQLLSRNSVLNIFEGGSP